jgi:hypothetical protein
MNTDSALVRVAGSVYYNPVQKCGVVFVTDMV